MGDQPHRKAATYTGQHKKKKSAETSMSRVGFEPPNIPVFEREETSNALDRAAIMIGWYYVKPGQSSSESLRE
jgi:hypothetical protein